MNASAEAIQSNIETLVQDGYTVKISPFSEMREHEHGHYRQPLHLVTVTDEDGKIVATGQHSELSEAMASAYAATPETEK